MLRNIIFCVSALVALAGCATRGPYIYAPPSPAAYPDKPAEIFAGALSAPLHGELLVCRGNVSNSGPVGERGEALLYTPYIYTAAGPLLRLPSEEACLSSGFGYRGDVNGAGRSHIGIDLANANGGFVYAAADGHVVSAGWFGGYGIVLELDHGNGVRTLYAHLDQIDPRFVSGTFVPAGTPVARMGSTGNATGIHLHYELSIDGLKVDPLSYGSQPPYIG